MRLIFCGSDLEALSADRPCRLRLSLAKIADICKNFGHEGRFGHIQERAVKGMKVAREGRLESAENKLTYKRYGVDRNSDVIMDRLRVALKKFGPSKGVAAKFLWHSAVNGTAEQGGEGRNDGGKGKQ